MDITQALTRLQCTKYSTLEEIRVSYRKLAKLVHPDLNKTIDPGVFRSLQEAYDFLIEFYKPEVAPTPPPKPDGPVQNFFEFIKPDATNVNVSLSVPTNVLDIDTFIYFMQGSKEFRVLLKKGTVLPTTLKITNLGRNMTINVTHHIDMRV